MQKCNNCSHVCVSLCTFVVHNTAQSSSDYLPSYPPDKHQSSDAVCSAATQKGMGSRGSFKLLH